MLLCRSKASPLRRCDAPGSQGQGLAQDRHTHAAPPLPDRNPHRNQPFPHHSKTMARLTSNRCVFVWPATAFALAACNGGPTGPATAIGA